MTVEEFFTELEKCHHLVDWKLVKFTGGIVGILGQTYVDPITCVESFRTKRHIPTAEWYQSGLRLGLSEQDVYLIEDASDCLANRNDKVRKRLLKLLGLKDELQRRLDVA